MSTCSAFRDEYISALADAHIQVQLNVGGCIFVTRSNTLLRQQPSSNENNSRNNNNSSNDDDDDDTTPSSVRPLVMPPHTIGVALLERVEVEIRKHQQENSSLSTTSAVLPEDSHALRSFYDTLLASLPEPVTIFIDRDGTHFRYILNYLRDGDVVLPPDATVYRELLMEARYYRLGDVVASLRSALSACGDNYSPQLTPVATNSALVPQPPPPSNFSLGLPDDDNDDDDDENKTTTTTVTATRSLLPDMEDLPTNTSTHMASCVFKQCVCTQLISAGLRSSQQTAHQQRRSITGPPLLEFPTIAHHHEDDDGNNNAGGVGGGGGEHTTHSPSSSSADDQHHQQQQQQQVAASLVAKTAEAEVAKTTRRLSTNPAKNIFAWEEIARHNTIDSCWLVVSNKVYDVTQFIELHPAGVKAILNKGGMDCTRDFNFHSAAAQRIWRQFEIGRVKGTRSVCIVM